MWFWWVNDSSCLSVFWGQLFSFIILYVEYLNYYIVQRVLNELKMNVNNQFSSSR